MYAIRITRSSIGHKLYSAGKALTDTCFDFKASSDEHSLLTGSDVKQLRFNAAGRPDLKGHIFIITQERRRIQIFCRSV